MKATGRTGQLRLNYINSFLTTTIKMNNKEIKEQLALNYIQEQVNIGRHLPHKEINKKFNIRNQRITSSDLYKRAGISLLNLKCKRPNA